MLGTDIRGKRSGTALESIESPPGTVWDLIKWESRRLNRRVEPAGGECPPPWPRKAHCSVESVLSVYRDFSNSGPLPMLMGPLLPHILYSTINLYSQFKDQLKPYFTLCSFLKTQIHIELSHPYLHLTRPFLQFICSLHLCSQ